MRLFDFGLAQLADADTLTAVGDVPGTLAYISPERLHGEEAGPAGGRLGRRACFSGRRSRVTTRSGATSPLETGEVIKAGAPSIGEARPDLPERLVAAVDAALSVNPAQRPSAARLSKALREAWLERVPRRARPKARDPVRSEGGACPKRRPPRWQRSRWAGRLGTPLLPGALASPARGGRRCADVCTAAGRARVHAGGARVPAREHVVRARALVRGAGARMADAHVGRRPPRTALRGRNRARADRPARARAPRGDARSGTRRGGRRSR